MRVLTVTPFRARIVRTMRCGLVRSATRLGGHMTVSLRNPHLHASRDLTHSVYPMLTQPTGP